MTEGLNPYEIFLHEKNLSLERQSRRREEAERQHERAMQESKDELAKGSWWTMQGKKKKAK